MDNLEQFEIDLDSVVATQCKRDFFRFVQEFWTTIIHEVPVWNWHIEVLCDELQQVAERLFARQPKLYDLVINVPPGSTKSTICSQMFLAWCWTRDPSLRFITPSYAWDIAVEQAQYTRIIVQSDKYMRLFPHVELRKDQYKKDNYRTTRGGQRRSCGIGGAVTGIHAHCILTDDPLNPKEAASDVEIKTANDFMSQTLSQRKVDRQLTPEILIMQRLHENDPSGVALRERGDEIRHICLPAECDDGVKPADFKTLYKDSLLDPVRLPRSVLEAEKKRLGSFGYSGQFMQRPVPDGGGIWKKHWFKHINMDDVGGMARTWCKGAPVWMFVADLAYTEKEMNDPSGCIAYARMGPYLVIRKGKRWRLEQPDLERALPTWCIKNGYSEKSLLLIEPKANGLSTVQNLRRRISMNVLSSKAPTKDKVSRARDSAPIIESGRVMIVDDESGWTESYLDEVTAFPFAKHDEFVDCTNIAIEREQIGGISAAHDNMGAFGDLSAKTQDDKHAGDVWDAMF